MDEICGAGESSIGDQLKKTRGRGGFGSQQSLYLPKDVNSPKDKGPCVGNLVLVLVRVLVIN